MQKTIDKINSLSFKKIFLILIFIFGLSVIPRLTNLNRPLSLHHEWLTSTSIRTIQIWYENGASKYNFNQIMTFNNEADKNIKGYNSFIPDKSGDFYYISYPPFGMIWPYFTFKLLHIYPSVLALQIFNLFLHLISGFFIFLILKTLTNKNNLASLTGFTLYLFAPVTMWFQSNVYMSDTAVQPLFIIGLYLFLKITRNEKIKSVYVYLLGLLIFLMIYTEWIGVLFALWVFVYCLFNLKKKNVKLLLVSTILAGLSAAALTLFQYSKINNLSEIFKILSGYYSYRSGFVGYGENSNYNPWDPNVFSLTYWIKLTKHYQAGLLSLLFFSVITFLWLIKEKLTFLIKKNKNMMFWGLSIFPVIAHHLILFNWSVVHDISVLKSVPFFALLSGYLISKIKFNKKNIYFFSLLFIFTIYSSIIIYLSDNYYLEPHYKTTAEIIKKIAKSDEVVFIKNKHTIEPHYLVYARRNIATYKNKEAAQLLIQKNNARWGIVFEFNHINKEEFSFNYYYIK